MVFVASYYMSWLQDSISSSCEMGSWDFILTKIALDAKLMEL
jgi:hypothetical protein